MPGLDVAVALTPSESAMNGFRMHTMSVRGVTRRRPESHTQVTVEISLDTGGYSGFRATMAQRSDVIAWSHRPRTIDTLQLSMSK